MSSARKIDILKTAYCGRLSRPRDYLNRGYNIKSESRVGGGVGGGSGGGGGGGGAGAAAGGGASLQPVRGVACGEEQARAQERLALALGWGSRPNGGVFERRRRRERLLD